jgi:AcrR family transcriptional regulator
MQRTKHEVVAQFRQGEILQAACRVFARNGFEATTVDAVAAEAGLAKGTLYLYFKSKLDIYIAALQEELEALDQLTHQRVEASAGCAEKLRAFVETRLAYLDDHSDFFKIYQFEFSSMFLHPLRSNSAFAAYYRRQVDFLALLINEGIRGGEFTFANAEAGAFLVYDTVRGVATRRLLGLSKLSLAEDTNMAISFISSGIGGAL